MNGKTYRTRFFHNSNIRPSDVEVALARKQAPNQIKFGKVYTRTVSPDEGNNNKVLGQQNVDKNTDSVSLHLSAGDTGVCDCECIRRVGEVHEIHAFGKSQAGEGNKCSITKLTDNVDVKVSDGDSTFMKYNSDPNSVNAVSPFNTVCDKNLTIQPYTMQDNNYPGVDEKFVNSIMHANQLTDQNDSLHIDTPINHAWHCESEFKFGYVPVTEQTMPGNMQENNSHQMSPFEMHMVVKSTARPNFLQARLPVKS